MHGLTKLLNSSTAWLGALVAGITTWSQGTGHAVPTWLAAAIVGAYGIKELGTKIGDAMVMKSINERESQNGAK